ncbi:MAG: apolipoprotein N-acyltransferase [Actinobacteria bacterium]|nr:MAG: apolipoprotein N-acyltransferase [Actinomycetota bacterium]
MRRALLLSVAAGLVVAATVPPFGWWLLGPPGLALLAAQLGRARRRDRLACVVAFALGLYVPSLYWVHDFTLPGWFLFALGEALITAVPFALVPPGRGRLLAFPGAVVAADAFRGRWPFGGLPLAGIDLGQAGGPLAPVVGIAGRLLLIGLVAVAAVGLLALVRRQWRAAVVAFGVVVAVAVVARVAPAGRPAGSLRVAAVQGGGERGLRALYSNATDVFDEHLAASRLVRPPVDLVVWPEDVVDVDRLHGSPQERELQALARSLHTTLIAGIVEDAGPTHFHNLAVAYAPDGREVDRYEKVHRVPFGEYWPGRSLFRHFASIPERAAVPGRPRAGIVTTPVGRFGVLISYEVFIPSRARRAATAPLLLVPTNASSFRLDQVPAQEIAAARLRALETGRSVVQAAPTGFSALIDHRGRVLRHTDLSARQAIQGRVQLRRGDTLYDRTGDWPVVGVALLALAAGALLERRPSQAAQ